VYAYPSEKSIKRFKDRIRQLTKRRIPVSTEQIIAEMSPIVQGLGRYYKRSRVRKLFTQLDGWIVRRLWFVAIVRSC
jgi:RNA-directed DNA polymerase